MGAILLKAGSFILIIIAGYLFKKTGLFHEQDRQTLVKLVTCITLPSAVIASFGQVERDMSLVMITILGIFMNVLMAGVGYLLAFRKSGAEKAFNMFNYSGYNIGTFAMPYLQSFLGATGILAACLFDCGNAVMCTGVTYAVGASCAEGGPSDRRPVGKGFFRNLISSVPFDCYLIMMLLYFAGIRFPALVCSIAGTFASANAFLAMFVIGSAFEFCTDIKKLSSILGNQVIRFGVAAMAAVLFYRYLPFSVTIRKTLAIVVFAPVSSLGVINTSKCGGDVETAGIISSVSILISLTVMTSLVSFLQLGI